MATLTRATKLESYLSAAWCGLSLLVIGAFLTIVSGTLHKPGDDLAFYLGQLEGKVLSGYVVVLTFGVASGRFLLRALPPPMADKRGSGRPWAVVLYAAAFVSLYMACVLGWLGFLSSGTTEDSASLPFAVLWVIAAIGVLIHHHYKRRAFLERPFVLFLRRFSTFSDRAVVAVILRQAAYNVPVVFLTPTLSRAGDWDLFIVGFAGLKLFHPWRSAPIVIRAQDDAWQEAAEDLIRRAQTILLDVSDTSGALRAECEMLDRAGRWSDTVCL